MIEAYPLTWPREFPRSKSRMNGQFKASLAGALSNVEHSLKLFSADSGKKIESLVISSNVSLGQQRPTDPGVAAWFSWDGLQVCIPVDRYSSVASNLQEIHHIVEARRTELRHGGLAIVRATFTGFKALPAPGNTSNRWRAVLGADQNATLVEAQRLYKAMRAIHHPDRGGSVEQFHAVQAAWEQAQQELG